MEMENISPCGCKNNSFDGSTLNSWDQLNAEHSWFEEVNDNVCYVMFEMRQETDYVKHHIQKVVAFFGAMRNFARAREKEGIEFCITP